MPTAATLERFIALVEQNAHVEALEQFYTASASMQENQAPPRVGRDALVANERRVLSRAKSVSSQCVRPVFVDGDNVVVRWIFRFEWPDGTGIRMEEIAWQRWEGERIAEEKFFYDPAQLIPGKPTESSATLATKLTKLEPHKLCHCALRAGMRLHDCHQNDCIVGARQLKLWRS